MKNPLDQYNSIYSAFHEHVESVPDKCAVVFEDTQISYSELNQKVLNLCHHLKSKGIQSGDSVAVILPNCYEYTVILLAASKLKLLLVPFNIGLPVHSILSNYQSLDIKYSFVWFGLIDEVLNIDNSISDSLISIGNSDLQNQNDFKEIESIKNHISDSDNTFDDEDSPYIICMTSGSTGNPKPIVLNQKTKLKRIKALEDNYGVNNNDVTLAATPLYHSLAMRLVLQPLTMGGTSIILNGFSVKKWISSIKEHGISFTIAVSSQLKQISEHLQTENNYFNSLRVLVSSSEQLNVFVKQKLINHLKCEFHECYGTSEIGIASNLNTTSESKIHSVGKAINEVDIVILDDDYKTLASNCIGEIACNTSMVFSEYLGQPETTKKSFYNDYFLTGDLGYLDDDGYLHYKGRKKELIISGGINIYPKDIEDTIKQLDGAKEVAAIPKQDTNLGEVVIVFIVKEKETDLSLKTLKQHCAKNLADFQFPREFHFTDELPKNSLGKIQKHRLRDNNLAEIA